MIWLFIYVLAISLYDLRTRRIPNWYTLPLIIAGMVEALRRAWLPAICLIRSDFWLPSFTLFSFSDLRYRQINSVAILPLFGFQSLSWDKGGSRQKNE